MRIDNIVTVAGDTGFVQQTWTTAGTIQAVGIAATGSSNIAPTVPTNHVVNVVSYKQTGPKTYKVRGIYQSAASATGGAAGSGDYLFTLPAGLQFDLSVPGQAAYTANPATNDGVAVTRAIPGSNVVMGQTGGTYANGWPTGIVPWDATRYRIGAFTAGNSTYCWQSGYFAMTQNNLNARWEFEFQSL